MLIWSQYCFKLTMDQVTAMLKGFLRVTNTLLLHFFFAHCVGFQIHNLIDLSTKVCQQVKKKVERLAGKGGW